MNIATKLFKTNKEGAQKAYGSITIENAVAIRISVIESAKGKFVSFPSRKKANGEYEDLAFPVSKEARAEITDAVMKAYAELDSTDASDKETPAWDEGE